VLNYNGASKWRRIKARRSWTGFNPLYLCIVIVMLATFFIVYHSWMDEEEALGASYSSAAETPPPPVRAEGVSTAGDFLNAPPAGRPVAPSQSGVSVLIEKRAYRLLVLRDGVKIKEYGIAVGKNGGDKKRVGDMRTPEGTFAVQQFQDSSRWAHDFRDGKGSIRNAYGPIFIRLKTPPWRGIGIHGTHDPGSIGTSVTEGCIRMNNRDLLEFQKLISVGTKVTIRP
jgi:lipoprotein-anchoring transpeptidase ErfK/SrfK